MIPIKDLLKLGVVVMTAIVLYRNRKKIKRKIYECCHILTGKTLYISGCQLAGKTTLAKYISDNIFPTKTQATFNDDKKTLESKKYGIKVIIDGRHHDGDKTTFGVERRNIEDEKTDIVLFLFDIKKLNNDDYYKDCETKINFFRNKCNENKKIFLTVATHIDKLDGFDEKKAIKENLLNDNIFKSALNTEKNIKRLSQLSEIVYISLIDKYNFMPESIEIIFEKLTELAK